jgi:hypothetical protein
MPPDIWLQRLLDTKHGQHWLTTVGHLTRLRTIGPMRQHATATVTGQRDITNVIHWVLPK